MPNTDVPHTPLMGKLHMELRKSVKRKVDDWQPSSVKNYQQLMVNDEQSSSVKHNDRSSIQISPNLTVSVEDGEYGLYVKIKRGEKWICLSASLWEIINRNLDKLRKVDQVIFLTREKRLEVINYMGKRYVSFIHKTSYQDSEYTHYINFNDDEWSMILEKMKLINSQLSSI